MIVVHGKEIPTEVAELVDPRATALAIIDMQNDLLRRRRLGRRLGRRHVDVPRHHAGIAGARRRLPARGRAR